MNRGNRGLNDRAIDLLDVQPSSRVLDLGFGGGLTLPPLLARAATVTGVDRAPDMVDAARARHASAMAEGRLTLAAGDVARLPLADDAVDRVLTVNTVYFWPDLSPALGEIRRVLGPGGRLVIGIRDGAVMQQVSRDIFTIRSPAELAEALTGAGFHAVEVVSAPDGQTHLIAATG
jgi:SAM-dependent methyltransferase